ncbi:MAG: HAMP domain-containing histidine kinase [Gemmatimonadetes bacterium]|nr:HAMP domain-containing histidine kinase [Gemmatimonadota bacterium]
MRVTLRARFVLVFVTFSLLVTAAVGSVSWWIAREAIESELDERLVQVAGAAAATGLQSSLVLGLEPGDELRQLGAWTSTQQMLLGLRRYVDGAYIVDGQGRALVTHAAADSFPIGTPLRFLEPYAEELAEARTVGFATTTPFEYQGRLYKYGFVQLEQSPAVLAVLVPATFLQPVGRLGRTLLLGSLFAALMAAGLGALLATGIIEPLERLSRSAIRIQRGNLRRPVAPEPGVEVGQLSRAMERMREAVVERDERLRLMVAQVAHEIRNPLGGLELFAAAAAEADDPVERRRLIHRIRGEIAALNDIISDFLTFARPLPVSPDVIDLREPLREASDLVEGVVAARGGTLEVDLPDRPLLARADAEHVKRATLNLLRNAAQAGHRVRLEAELKNGEAAVSVLDDGPGVEPEDRERIFEPFVTDKEQGAGLGLAIVKKVVEGMGGRVEVGSADRPGFGKGARFGLYFMGFEDIPAATRELELPSEPIVVR